MSRDAGPQREPKAKRVTQQDIARALGVSHVAVSHVLHRSQRARISAEKQREILEMAERMGYQPRFATTHTICLVVEPQSLWTDVTTNILVAADSLLRERGYRMSLATLDRDSIGQAPALFNQKTVDGVIFTEWYSPQSHILHQLQVPWLLLADTPEELDGVEQVGLDTEGTAAMLSAYLVSLGHLNQAVVVGRQGVGFHERVVRGVQENVGRYRFGKRNLTVVYDQGGQRVQAELLPRLDRPDGPTAIIAASPGDALVTMNRLQRAGVGIPADVSLVSLVDSPRLAALAPSITATDAVGHGMVSLALDRLQELIRNPAQARRRTWHCGELIERESSELYFVDLPFDAADGPDAALEQGAGLESGLGKKPVREAVTRRVAGPAPARKGRPL